MRLVYTEHITSRVDYTFRLLPEHIIGIAIRFTNDKEKFCCFDGPSLNYSNHPLSDKEVYVDQMAFCLNQSSNFVLFPLKEKQKGPKSLFERTTSKLKMY